MEEASVIRIGQSDRKETRRLAMEKFLPVIFFAVLALGCGGPPMELSASDQGITLYISRSVAGVPDPGIKVQGESAEIDYLGRRITVKNPGCFGSYNNFDTYYGRWVVNVRIENDRLVLSIPKDAPYEIWIGKEYHFWTQISEQEDKK